MSEVDVSGAFRIRITVPEWTFKRKGNPFRYEQGVYQVPTQIPPSIAREALNAGVAEKLDK